MQSTLAHRGRSSRVLAQRRGLQPKLGRDLTLRPDAAGELPPPRTISPGRKRRSSRPGASISSRAHRAHNILAPACCRREGASCKGEAKGHISLEFLWSFGQVLLLDRSPRIARAVAEGRSGGVASDGPRVVYIPPRPAATRRATAEVSAGGEPTPSPDGPVDRRLLGGRGGRAARGLARHARCGSPCHHRCRAVVMRRRRRPHDSAGASAARGGAVRRLDAAVGRRAACGPGGR
jgi:hypothetical protein